VLALATGAAGTLPASAADYVTGEWGYWQGMRTFWGNMTVQGTYGLCVDPGAEPPDTLNPAHATQVCGTVTNGVADKTAQTGWLLGRHLHDTDTQTLVSLSQFARAGYHTGIPVTYPARYNELAAEAAHAGPKDAYVEVDLAAGKVWFGLVRAGEAAQITSGALPRGSAHHTPGFTAVITLTTANASFAGGAKTVTVTTGAAAGAVAFTTSHDLIADEKVAATVTVKGAPGICLTLYEEGSYQRVITPVPPKDLAGAHTATQAKTVWQPKLTTEVTTPIVEPDGTVTDKVRAEAVGGSQWPVKQWADPGQTKPGTYHPFTAAGQLVWSPTPATASKTLPAGSKVLPGKATAVLAGPGVWTAATVSLPADAGSGFYSLRWCLDKADQGGNAKFLPDGGPFCDDYHAATERFTVPMRIAVSTRAPASVVQKGDPADDTVTLSLPGAADQWLPGLDGKPLTVTAHGTLYGSSVPFAEQAGAPEDAEVLGEADVDVALPTSGREPVTVKAPAGFDLKGSTHWTWVWEVRRADQAQRVAEMVAADAKDTFGKPAESGHAPMTLAVTTKLPDQHQPKGEPPDDTITVSLPNPDDQWIARADGKPAVLKAKGVFYAGSASSFTISADPPPDARKLGEATVDITLPTSGREPVTVAAPAGFTVPTSQYGTWVWEIRRADQAPQVAALFDNDPRDRFGQRLETHATQMELKIRSQVYEAAVPEPKGDGLVEVCDRVWVEHTDPADLWLNQWGTNRPARVRVDGELRHAAVPGPATEVVDDGVPAVADWALTFEAAGEANAQTVCHQVAHGAYGAYGFTWRIELGRQPEATKDLLSKGAVSALWLLEETTMVRRVPVVHTAATSWTATNNGAGEVFLTDEIWQTGWPDGPEDSGIHGAVGHGDWAGYGPWEADGKVIRVELWRIEGDITPESCSAENPAARLVAVNEAVSAANTWDGANRVSGSRFKADGGDATYTFVVTWPGDARTEPYRSVCGEASETITVNRQAPEFATRLLVAPTQGGPTDSQPFTANGGPAQAGPGAELVDVLQAVFPDQGSRRADMRGWEATWEFHHQPLPDGGQPPAVVEDDAGEAVFEGAVCSPDNLFAAVGPIPVEAAGEHHSPPVTAPDAPGMVYAVETVRDQVGEVVRRGACGVVAESAIITTPPAPGITTTAPERATVGEVVTDLAELTGPFPEGTVVEFWYQATSFTDPGAAPEDLACEPPDPDDMEGAVRIGAVTLDHPIPVGETEELSSPEFTVTEPGCTWIKEIAYRPGDGPDREIMTEGRFDALNERTIWEAPPPPSSPPSTPPGLPRTGADVWVWGGAALGAVAAGIAAVVVGRRRRSDLWG
jgi:hypothetical protein